MATRERGARETRREDRRRTIVAAAERAFFARGYGGVSMSTLAAELGGSKATLWAYFPNKEALFLAVLDARVGDFARRLDELLDAGGGPAATLGRFGSALLSRLLTPEAEALRRLLASEAPRVPGMADAYYQRGLKRVRERLARFLAAAMEAGELRRGDPVLAARQFFALCQAGTFQDRLWHDPVTAEPDVADEIARAVDTFLRAWGAVGGSSSGAEPCSATR